MLLVILVNASLKYLMLAAKGIAYSHEIRLLCETCRRWSSVRSEFPCWCLSKNRTGQRCSQVVSPTTPSSGVGEKVSISLWFQSRGKELWQKNFLLQYSTGLHLGKKKIKNGQTNIITDFESQSSGLNDNSSSLGSDCCYSNFFLFFSIYAPYARWYEVKYCIYARSRHTCWGLIIAGGWRKCSDSRTGAEGRKAQVVHSN